MEYCRPKISVCPPSNGQGNKPCTCEESYFSVLLGDVKTYSVPATTHEIKFVRGAVVYDIDGEELGVQVNIDTDDIVTISANISLLNSTLIIF